ncbi:serine/threonine protein kinase [bacterium 1XD21-13]|nr:serine/threonine protein kinase [bacterium 1XD21-13]
MSQADKGCCTSLLWRKSCQGKVFTVWMNERRRFILLETGTVIDGKYRILYQIGQGGMSVVYLAINERANKTWAVKEVRRETGLGTQVVRERLMAETELLKRLRHPRLPAIVDVIDEGESLLIVMDYIEGRSLKEVLAQEGAQSQEQVLLWGKQLCEVLSYLHEQKPSIIYRDMKPSNIMVQPDGSLKLIDFGTAREIRDSCTGDDTVCLGTPGYAAPEQWGGSGQTDQRTDIYCLGAVLYEAVTGQEPGREPFHVAPVGRWKQGLSAGLEEILKRCTRQDPKDRFQSCRELAYALDHYEEMDLLWRRKQKGRLGSFLVTAFLSLLCFLGAFYARLTEVGLERDTYQAWMERIFLSDIREEKIEACEGAIRLNPSREEGYLELLNQVFLTVEEDGMISFTREEDEHLRGILNRSTSGGKTYEMCLKENREGYERVAYELGLAYYYDYEGEGNKSYGVKWLNIAAEGDTLPKACRERALRLGTIGAYYSQIGQVNRAGDAKVSYQDYWRDLTSLASGNLVQLDNAVTALRMYQELASQIHGRALEFRYAGIPKEEMEEELKKLQKHLEEDFTDVDWREPGLEEMKSRLIYLLGETKRQLDAVYEGERMEERKSYD